jgi:Fur family transcriptional regulator, stress-responsive regulator
MPPAAELEGMLRDASLRVTRPRVAVLAAVYDHPHADTFSIIGHVREDLGGVSQQAVYDVLQALTEAGLVRRIQPRGSVARTSRASATTITTSSAGRAAPSPTSIAPPAPHPA